MLASHEIESLRRSNAMAPLSPTHVAQLLETCAQLAAERAAVAAVLADLPESFAAVRAALNQLQRIVTADVGMPAATAARSGPADRPLR